MGEISPQGQVAQIALRFVTARREYPAFPS